jgi:hypothetical protein
MKLSRIVTALFAGSLLLAGGAFAQERGTLKLSDKINVQGTELKPGQYDFEWEGSGSSVQVTIRKGKENIVTVPANLVAKEKANVGGGYGAKTEADGSRTLFALFPAGKKVELEISQKQASVTP